MTGNYGIEQFMDEAKGILAEDGDLEAAKAAIADRLAVLSRRDDLTRYGLQLGPTDASNDTYLLWREPPYFTLIMVRFDQFFLSPVHDHAAHWIVACGYRGAERWDIYERTDGGTGAGPCELAKRDEVLVEPAGTVYLSQPRSIHSHNNVSTGDTLELIFSAAPPTPASERMLFDVPAGTCRPSWYEISDQLEGDHFPPRL